MMDIVDKARIEIRTFEKTSLATSNALIAEIESLRQQVKERTDFEIALKDDLERIND